MIYGLTIIPICIGALALGAVWADHQTLCNDLSAASYADFKAGAAPVLAGRCPVPKPLQ